jgi:hypothetical protein
VIDNLSGPGIILKDTLTVQKDGHARKITF